MPTATTTNRYPKYLTATDFGIGSSPNIAIPVGKWTLLVSYTVPAQQEIAVGQTEAYSGGGQGAVSYMRFDNTDTNQLSTELFRVQITDANEVNTQVIYEDIGTRWSASSTDRTLSKLLPEDFRRVQEDGKIQITCKTTAASKVWAPVDADNSIILPVTVYTLRR